MDIAIFQSFFNTLRYQGSDIPDEIIFPDDVINQLIEDREVDRRFPKADPSKPVSSVFEYSHAGKIVKFTRASERNK